MSGGSYNYLAYTDASTLHEKETQLELMTERLAGLGYANDAAKEAIELLLTLRQSHNLLDVYMDRLNGIFHAVEWWDSHDFSEDAVKDALAKYRAPLQQPSE